MTEEITRDAARAAGLPRYFDGCACHNHHIAERSVATGRCVECVRGRNSRGKHHRVRWRTSGAPAARALNRFKNHKRRARRGGYMPAPHERDCPPRPMHGRCARCDEVAPSNRGNAPGRDSLVLDHDHETGAFRGWLCSPCNSRIEAVVRDDLTRAYLEGHGEMPF